MASSTLDQLKLELAKVQSLEDEFLASKWNKSTTAPSSPQSVIPQEGDASNAKSPSTPPTSTTSLLERYQQARNLYLQRRFENMIVDYAVGTYHPETNDFDLPPSGGDSDDIQDRHAHALATIQTSIATMKSHQSQYQTALHTLQRQRHELEETIQDLESSDCKDVSCTDDEDSEEKRKEMNMLQEEDMELQEQRVLELERTKTRLQNELQSLQQERTASDTRLTDKKEEYATLLRQRKGNGEAAASAAMDEDDDALKSKIHELREMKIFYDSLREVLEELGGIKLDKIEAATGNENPGHLYLHLILNERFPLRIVMAPIARKNCLKVVDAQWWTTKKDGSSGQQEKQYISDQDSTFRLELASMDSLVKVAQSTFSPPHDIRFLIREALARIRWTQHRVDDLSLLRQRVLTKVVVGENDPDHDMQVICSLNEGVVIVMRLYEEWTRVEQIVGVSGWDKPKVLDELKKRLVVDQKATPSSIVAQVQPLLKTLEEEFEFVAKTPRLPSRTATFFDDNDDETNETSTTLI